jgi:hypothetical protein
LGGGREGRTERQVGKLVQFEKRQAPRVKGRPPVSDSAEILMFTGVRYERGEPTMPPKPTASPSAKRKRG